MLVNVKCNLREIKEKLRGSKVINFHENGIMLDSDNTITWDIVSGPGADGEWYDTPVIKLNDTVILELEP